MKQDFSPDFKPIDYVIWAVLELILMQLPIEILVRLKLLLRRNGIYFERIQIVSKASKNGGHIE